MGNEALAEATTTTVIQFNQTSESCVSLESEAISRITVFHEWIRIFKFFSVLVEEISVQTKMNKNKGAWEGYGLWTGIYYD